MHVRPRWPWRFSADGGLGGLVNLANGSGHMLLGTMLFGESPYRNVIVNGLVLAEDGKKISQQTPRW